MTKENKTKIIVAWIFLILLTTLALALSYIKFFGIKNENIEERPVENSTSQAIETALKNIVDNFNHSEKLEEYSEQGISIRAKLNQHSIYISYISDTTTTYEFSYNNLNLNITVSNESENLQKFKAIYEILIEAVQKRIGNTANIKEDINAFLNDEKEYEGLKKETTEETIIYHMDITKKIGTKIDESLSDNQSEN